MNFIEFLKNKKKEFLKPELVTLIKYKVNFKTVDGEWHEFDNYNYINEDAIRCSATEYIIANEKYLKDNDSNMYPLSNIICIKWEISDVIENVIEKRICNEIRYTFYDKEDIEIWSEEE